MQRLEALRPSHGHVLLSKQAHDDRLGNRQEKHLNAVGPTILCCTFVAGNNNKVNWAMNDKQAQMGFLPFSEVLGGACRSSLTLWRLFTAVLARAEVWSCPPRTYALAPKISFDDSCKHLCRTTVRSTGTKRPSQASWQESLGHRQTGHESVAIPVLKAELEAEMHQSRLSTGQHVFGQSTHGVCL